MPFITLTGGLTLKVPTRGTTDWDTEFLNNFATPISNHTHTGSGDGNQLGSGSLVDNAVSDLKMRLRNNQYMRSRNFLGNADINILKINASDELEVSPNTTVNGTVQLDSTISVTGAQTFVAPTTLKELKPSQVIALTNNTAVAADITGVLIDTTNDKAVIIDYAMVRLGTADLTEKGKLEITYANSAFQIVQEFSRDNSGIVFSITAGGQLQYTLTDNTGSSSENLHVFLTRLGD